MLTSKTKRTKRMTRMTSVVSHWLDVPSTDPDDARRRKLLNILLAGIAALVLLALAATVIGNAAGLLTASERFLLYQTTILTLIGIAVIFAINRYWSGQIAGALFLLLLLAALAFSDEPKQVADGRALFLFSIPILTASVILRPWASFIAAGLSGLEISVIALRALQGIPPVPTILGLFAVALVSWISARTLERALADLRAINRELDHRVEERTRDLAEALSRNQAILEAIADGVIVFDTAGKATLANPAMAQLVDHPPEEIIGHDIKALANTKVNQEDLQVIGELLRDTHRDYPTLKLEWGRKTLSASFAPVRDDSGRRTGTVVVFRDFTREAEVERMKSAFVSSISHELRTPLNAILGYADMLKEGVYGPVVEKQAMALERIIVNGQRQLNIVNDLLDQAQIEAGTLKIKVAPFSPRDLVEDVTSLMEVLARSKGLTLTGHVANDVPDKLPGDRQRLRQILINLVDNAIKFTAEGSVQIQVYLPDARHWAMEVTDTGRGIPLEAQPYIFEPFRQVDDPTTREHAGSGLGLAIVKQLTNLMGGEVVLKSQVGHGSTFTIILPLVPIQEDLR